MADRSEYFKKYHQAHKEEIRRVNLTFTPTEFRELRRAAKKRNRTTTAHIRLLSLQACRKKIELPQHIEEDLHDMRWTLSNIGNNLNQMARHSNEIRHVVCEGEALQEMKRLYDELEVMLKKMAGEGE